MEKVQNRDLFFKFLEENGLSPETNKSILEIAPSVIQSQSALLVEKYGKLYNQFLLSRRFEYGNKYGVKGAVGGALLHRGKTLIMCDNLNKISLCNERVEQPIEEDFDTLLIQGQIDDAYSLSYSKLSLLFGDVLDTHDINKLNAYKELFRLINNKFGNYELVRETLLTEGKEAVLIKRK